MNPRVGTWAALSVLVMAALAVAVGFLVPLYSDEIAMQMARSRYFAEGGHLLGLLPQCGDVWQDVPISWIPGAVLNALLYAGASEWGLRLRGIALCLVWMALLWIWAGRHPQTLLSRRGFQALVVSLNLLGVMPLLLVLARSEQLMVIALAAYGLLPLYAAVDTRDGAAGKAAKTVLFIALHSVFLMAHPKALFFAPMMLLSSWLVFRRDRWLCMGMVLITGFMIAQTFQHARTIGVCANAPVVSQMLTQQTLDLSLIGRDPSAFVAAALHNLIAAPRLVIDRVPVTISFQSNWLPTLDNASAGAVLTVFGQVLKFSLWGGLLLLIAGVIFRALSSWRHFHANEATWLALALLASLMIHASVYSPAIWHFYTPGLIVPAAILLLMLVLHRPVGNMRWMRIGARAVACWVWVLAVASLALLLGVVTPRLVQVARADDFVIAGQPLSTPVFLSKARRSDMQRLAAQCRIRDGDDRLMIDGSGYFAFQHGQKPINVLYVSSYAFGGDIGSRLPEFLAQKSSAGVVARCEYLPAELLERATHSGSMCCVPRAALR
ncbi:hypothetical protein [Variovorax sp. PBL-E5]|uniref:hypothetical protein n=1 Tax=Variovorax sp. PBL-E5 TaxID=434014 RepID=UPI0013181F46|nr:hypothetical protein [Variovorax sp. PBL-E5]VTU18965.1 hypothetical protein E5CHR_00693 [Variovorax sp. PBL-E5]